MGPDEDQFDNGWKDCMSWYFVCDGTWRMLLLVGMSWAMSDKMWQKIWKKREYGSEQEQKKKEWTKRKSILELFKDSHEDKKPY